MATPSRGPSNNRAPEKGVFPLDHDGQCKDAMSQVMACIKQHQQVNKIVEYVFSFIPVLPAIYEHLAQHLVCSSLKLDC
jgi:hypothetical protein